MLDLHEVEDDEMRLCDRRARGADALFSEVGIAHLRRLRFGLRAFASASKMAAARVVCVCYWRRLH